MERHQFGFSFMRQDTGGQRVHSFWGSGKDREGCRLSALEAAKRYCYQYEQEINDKIRVKAERRGDRYLPSHVGVQIVSCSFWR